MKYNHEFKLIESNSHYRLYRSDNHLVRLDFFAHGLRVSMYDMESELFPTYTICPYQSKMPRHGRDRLSMEGIPLTSPKIVKNGNNESIFFDDIRIDIDLPSFRMHYYKNDRLLVEDREYIAYNFEHELGKGRKHFLTREEDEIIVGLGDKSGNINKNKRYFRMETSDAMGYDASSSDPLYKQIPFYMCKNSSGSYGIYYDTYSNGSFDFGQGLNNYYGLFKSFECEEESLVFYMFFSEFKDILRQFTMFTGKNMFPPKWTLKYGGSTMTYTDAQDADIQLRKFVELCRKYDLDCGGFYLSSGYTQIGEKRYVFHWNKDKIKDPKGLSSYFKDNGIEFLPNVKPAFLSTHPMYDEIAKKGWFLHYKDGSPALFPFWSGMGSYFDFTNDEAFEFWSACIKENLVDLGYGNIWNDNNEYDIQDDEVYANGFGTEIKAKLIRPLFPLLMTMSSYEGQDHSKRVMAVTRSGPMGFARIAETWTGDNNTSFKDFRYNHKIAMTLSLSGIYNFGQDIGGFAGPRPEKELFLRWIQYGLFTPRFVLHSWNPDGIPTMPWLYEDEMDTVKRLFNLRKRLTSYLYQCVYRSVEEYRPIIYPLFLEYPDHDIESDLFMVGDSILASPIFDQGVDKALVHLPEVDTGWYYKGKLVSGDIEITCTVHDEPAYFIKAGSIIPVEDENGLRFEIYPLSNGTIDYDYFLDDGESIVSDENSRLIHIHAESKNFKVEYSISEPFPVIIK